MDKTFSFIIGGPNEFSHGEVEFKGEKQYYVTGYVSTKDLDLVGDIVTEECLKDMVEQINSGNIKLDAEHEAWRNGNDGPQIIPVGRIVEAKYDGEGKRVWIKAVINQDNDRFKTIWANIKNKFLDAFSIAFRPVEKIMKSIGEKQVRLLQKVQLLNVALTGNPANPEARITEVFTKSLNYMEEEEKMSEEKIETPIVPEQKTNVLEEEMKNLKEAFEKQNLDFKEELKELQKQLGEREAEAKSLKEQLNKPQMKSLMEEKPVIVEKKEDAKKHTPLSML